MHYKKWLTITNQHNTEKEKLKAYGIFFLFFLISTLLATQNYLQFTIIINLVKYLYYNTYSIMYLQSGVFLINLPVLLYNIIMNLQYNS